MTKYLIKLEPLDTFFFGQESKYRRKTMSEKEEDKKQSKDKGKDNDEASLKADYFQRSAYFPQQTTLLGTLRYCLLKKNGQIPIKDTTEASKLIGTKSFEVSASKSGIGVIKDLSPVFIMNQNQDFYFQNPKDLLLKTKKNGKSDNPESDSEHKKYPEYLKIAETTFRSSLNEKTIFFSNYVEKEGLGRFLINNKSEILPFDHKMKIAEDGVFIEQEKIGITKGKDGKTLDKAFYKQMTYKLRQGFSFGFVAEIADNLYGYSDIISMGAEKSPFRISFDGSFVGSVEDKINWETCNTPKVVLLSDTYLEETNNEDFLFAISDTKNFRFLQSTLQEGHNYYSSNPLKKWASIEQGMERSKKYNLLERGSVFFFRDENQMNQFSKKLIAEASFRQIGYNHFKTIK